MDSDLAGHYKLPYLSESLLFDLSKTHLDLNCRQIVVIGIGGSSLGIKAIDSFLRKSRNNIKSILFLDNSDPLSISSVFNQIDLKSACFCLISKSGLTIETTSIFKALLHYFDLNPIDLQERLFVITDFDSPLYHFASSNNLHTFTIPKSVGGRFSVLSAVGLIPLYLAGYDVRAILKGAQEYLNAFFNYEETHIVEKALFLITHATTLPMHVLFSYADSLEDFNKWVVQLIAESLGKITDKGEHVGLTPISLIGALDQHSFLQLIIQGPRDKSISFINISDFEDPIKIPDISLPYLKKSDFINNKSFNLLINEQSKATMQSIIDSGVVVDSITLDRVSEENIGILIIYYELLTSLMGQMLQINTYDQPGVELGKEILYKNLTQ